MTKSTLTLCILLATGSIVFAQRQEIEKSFDGKAAVAEFTYLASDELMGRDPARPEMKLAYTFIATQLENAGAKPLLGADGFYQNIPFRVSSPPKSGSIKIGDSEFIQGKNMLVLDGKSFSGTFELVEVGFGTDEDFAGKDLAGKIAITNAGAPGKLSPNQLFAEGRSKTLRAKEAGAVALIERFNVPAIPWQLVSGFLNRPQMSVDQGSASELPYVWIEDLKNKMTGEKLSAATIKVEGKVNTPVEGKNVVAWIEGTDPKLKNEYIMLSAHYDHVGVGTPDAAGDSIYNGARDNAVGTVAVMNAAKFFAKNPPKRSILIALWTAEEKGLLGSAYFANNPLVPLNQIVYNLNIDNGGYNDTSIITVIGLGRTSADFLLEEAVAEFGIKAIADPSPEQGLYDRSDNVNFARKGIPAPTFSLGFTAFDDEIQKYYHKAGDHVDNFDLDYAQVYWKSYILSAQKIANWDQRPVWTPGDKYEEVSKALYGDN
ncbi:M28 family peptidase [Algoriphagus boritolerans]|uniref:Zn-dependent amino-or carboxypeptidase, M28 family n=1 Tax=Algoriphagus boritolerans DSM 17298 = JCM 18970 TaxID=1120964 RepID=A0A1H5Y1C2_9BACT|nr:M28 family peptidase [Algoriphagus boritolerans]SEG17879.1 Zn-dependent amino-or carboxypeptidase, M28 family [Algoriphagus boritolerans DSM 17298 = JCM 18970]